MLLRRFDFSFVGTPEDVGMRTGATIHTENGLRMYARPRAQATNQPPPVPVPAAAAEQQHVGPVGAAAAASGGGCPVAH